MLQFEHFRTPQKRSSRLAVVRGSELHR